MATNSSTGSGSVSSRAAASTAAAMVTASCVVSALALVASLPVVWVLRKHWRRFVCYSCRHSPFQIKKPPKVTESDIVLSLLLLLQSTDLAFAVGFLLSPLNHAGSQGATWICPLQGALLQFSGPAAMLFSACLSIELYIVIRGIMGGRVIRRDNNLHSSLNSTLPDQLGRWDTTVNARGRLNFYSIGTLTISGMFVLLDLIFDGFGPLRSNADADSVWCWVKDAADEDNEYAQFAFISYYGIAFFSIIVVISFYMLVIIKVCRRMRESYRSGSAKGLMRLLWKTVCRVGIYPVFLVIVLLPGTIHRLPAILNMKMWKSSPTMDILHAATMPLLGLIDALVLGAANTHVRKRIFRCIKCQPEIDEQEKTRWRSLSEATNRSVLDSLDTALEQHDEMATGEANTRIGGDISSIGGGVGGDNDGAWQKEEDCDVVLVETLRWSDDEDYDGPDYGSLQDSAQQLIDLRLLEE